MAWHSLALPGHPLRGTAFHDVIGAWGRDWRMTPRGSGHAAFFSLAAALQRAGLDMGEIRDKLWEEAAYGNSPRKRRGEIKDILKSLSRRGTLAGGSARSNHWWS